MKFAIAAVALTMASLSATASFSPARAALPPYNAYINKCGNNLRVCAAALHVHRMQGYKVTTIRYCGGQSTSCNLPGYAYGYSYRYWR